MRRGGRSVASLVGALCGLALTCLGASSCYNPNFVSGVTKCSPNGACPNDWVCRSGVCVDASATGSGGSSPTGGKGGGTGGSATGGHGGSGTGGAVTTGGAPGTGGSLGNGGATGTGGKGTGGTTSTGGSPGTGGSTLTCLQGESDAPVAKLITDFSDAAPDPNSSGDFRYGSSGGVMGGTARYASGTFGTLVLSGGALTYTATVEAPTTSVMYPFNGFAVFVDGPACVDASAYTGVAFTLSVTGNCRNLFLFSDSYHLTSTNDSVRGACTAASCYASQFAVTSATTSVAFAATPTVLGAPVSTVYPAKLTGVQWQFSLPDGATTGCSGSFTVDNIRFY